MVVTVTTLARDVRVNSGSIVEALTPQMPGEAAHGGRSVPDFDVPGSVHKKWFFNDFGKDRRKEGRRKGYMEIELRNFNY